MCSSWLAPAPDGDVSVLATNPAATVGAEEIRHSYRQQKTESTRRAALESEELWPRQHVVAIWLVV